MLAVECDAEDARGRDPVVTEGVSTVATVVGLDPTDRGAARWDVTFAVDDCDVVADRAAALGGRVLDGPVDLGPVRSARIADPAGATFTASQFFPERL